MRIRTFFTAVCCVGSLFLLFYQPLVSGAPATRKKKHSTRTRPVRKTKRTGTGKPRRVRVRRRTPVHRHGHHDHSSVHSRVFLYKKKEQTLLRKVAMLEKKRLETSWRRYQLEQQLLSLNERLQTLKTSLTTQKQISQMLLQRIRPRLRMVYRIARLGKARLLVGARTFSTMAKRWQRMKHLARMDLKLLNNYQKIQVHLKTLSRKLAAEKIKRLKLRRVLQKQQKDLTRTRNKTRATLQQLYKEAQNYKKVITSLYGSQARFQNLLHSWQTSGDLKGLWKFRGRLLWPVQGFSRTCSQFQLEWNKSQPILRCLKRETNKVAMLDTLGRQGWSFQVPAMTPIRAVAQGRVVALRWERGYGRLLILEHGQRFYSVYAHMAQTIVQKGDVVDAGQLLGTVGNSGLLGKARLYFELRYRARLLNPYNWLQAQPR